MDVNSFLGAVVGSALTSTIVGIFLSGWVDGRLTKLEHRLTIQREDLAEKRETERKQREASAPVADFLSQWIHCYYKGQTTNEDLWRIQSAYWKTVLWPDVQLVKALTPILAGRETGGDIKDIIIQVGKVLLQLSEADLTPSDLIHWDRVKCR